MLSGHPSQRGFCYGPYRVSIRRTLTDSNSQLSWRHVERRGDVLERIELYVVVTVRDRVRLGYADTALFGCLAHRPVATLPLGIKEIL
jgi:hypothetical protein